MLCWQETFKSPGECAEGHRARTGSFGGLDPAPDVADRLTSWGRAVNGQYLKSLSVFRVSTENFHPCLRFANQLGPDWVGARPIPASPRHKSVGFAGRAARAGDAPALPVGSPIPRG